MNALWLDERVKESLSVLSEFLESHEDFDSPLFDVTLAGLSRYALMGKHIRSRLVHIAAGQVEGTAREAAVVFGACIDLLHGSFLIHDDLIDRDDVRRGQPALHKDPELGAKSPHVGYSVAILAGDLGIARAFNLLATSQLGDSLVRSALKRLTQSCSVTIAGELLDVENSASSCTDPQQIRYANALKTADYTFACPLYLGSLAVGRNPALTDPIARELGAAFQAANDIDDAEVDAANNRTTLASFQTLSRVAAECNAHIDEAQRLIKFAHLPRDVTANLLDVAEWIRSSVKKVC